MATLESAVATRLRADTTLMAILLGKVWEWGSLGTEGITSAKTTAAAYAAGLLQPCAIIKQRALVPTNQIRDLKEKVADANQVLEVWLYERITSGAIEAAMDRVYALLEGYAFTGKWPAAWSFTLPVMPAPEFVGVKVGRIDFTIMSIRKAA